MAAVSEQHFSPSWEFLKIAMILVIYLPLDQTEPDRTTAGRLALIGVGMTISLALRNLVLWRRTPVWVRSAWVGLDLLAWYWSEAMLSWHPARLPFVGFILALDAAMIGWKIYRGALHWGVATLFVVLAPLIWGHPVNAGYLFLYASPVLIGAIFVYLFISLAGRMAEERATAARARQEAEEAQTEAERARKAAELANAQLREYATQVESLAVLRERNRLAREVHDTIAHAFTGIHMQVELIAYLLPESPERAAEALAKVREKVGESLDEVRRSVHALRPLQLEESQGLSSLERLVNEFARTTGVATDLVITGLPVELPVAYELCLYRTVQEGLTNAFRHGRAGRARIRLAYEPDCVILGVEDDGKGAPGPVAGGLGILGIHERVAALGGSVEAGNAPTGGFVLQVSLPLSTTRKEVRA
jgi:signal transduction histidine kinase